MCACCPSVCVHVCVRACMCHAGMSMYVCIHVCAMCVLCVCVHVRACVRVCMCQVNHRKEKPYKIFRANGLMDVVLELDPLKIEKEDLVNRLGKSA